MLDGPATVAADEDGAVAPMAVAGEDDVGYEQGIADIIEGGDAEDDIVDGTYGRQTTEIEDGLWCRQLVSHVVDAGYADDEHGPYRQEEEHQHRWY